MYVLNEFIDDYVEFYYVNTKRPMLLGEFYNNRHTLIILFHTNSILLDFQ